MLVNFDLIPQMTACRVGVDEAICRDVINFHWKLVADLLSSCTYSKVRVKGFANFEMKKVFLKKYNYKSKNNLDSANNNVLNYPDSKKAQDLYRAAKSNYDEFQNIYLKYWIEDDIK